ncbi:MAG: CRISPR-associated helicase Cas3', partial [Chloroflexi bacterium]|nr:CRISPR-associated helicase Cas3' [Chloroflexota bacterium]
MSRLIDDEEFIRLYTQPGNGYTDQELAERFEVGRDAIFKRRKRLEEAGYPIEPTERGRYKINREKLLSHIRVSQGEALVLYLATRRLSRSTRLAKRYVQNALEKLALALYKPMTEQLVKAAAGVPEHPEAKKREAILEVLIRGWTEQLKVHITYQGLKGDKPMNHTLSPYLIEPSPWSDSVYVIAKTNVWDGDPTPFQLERIEKASLSTEPFKVDPKFEQETLFKYAWGIWYSDKEPVTVKLRFSGREAIRRVGESVWHPQQQISQPDDQGRITWQAPIAEWREMLPWVRGWGADCEVLEPERLREELKADMKRSNRLYKIAAAGQNSPTDRLLRCWGKTGKDDREFHPALYHMLDVGHIAQQLLASPASPRWRQVLSRAFEVEPETLLDWLPWFVAMHDIGKISVPFQALNPAQKLRLESEGFAFGRWQRQYHLHHTFVGYLVLKDELSQLGLPERWLRAWREMIAGHHGVFGQANLDADKRTFRYIQEPDEWLQLRARAAQLLQSFLLRLPPGQWPEPTNISAVIMALTGFTILCDWLGSDSRYFTPHPYTDLPDYVLISRQQARQAVSQAGFFQPSRSNTPTAFESLFPGCTPARPLQQAIDAIPAELLAQPCLAIIEAPTGEGKTEAALALAHRLARSYGSDEFYCALPTMATSNQMFLRIQALLAPFGVGTVDQAELAALNVRHNALRVIGLAGKVVILDEVHAYDTYMTTIIEQMLRWLAALGSSVILLSATLPLSRRAALAQAYGVDLADQPIQEQAYPSLWLGSRAGTCHLTPPAYQPQRQFHLRHLHLPHDNAPTKARWLLDAVAGGGCACWITNTVDRAQQLAQAVDNLDPTTDLLLLHACFPLDDREHLEELIRQKYRPGGDRPARSIVIGTQVLEQSLDLDFDLMVSDLAPLDLLLQRMGRVHRHQNSRPEAHQAPHFWVNSELDPAQPERVQMGADRFYTEYILQKTWQTIANIRVITLPADYRPLIEAVYGTEPPQPGEALYEAWGKLHKQENKARDEAKLRLLAKPDPEQPFCRNNQTAFKEDEDSTAWFVAQTRLGQETVSLIPL